MKLEQEWATSSSPAQGKDLTGPIADIVSQMKAEAPKRPKRDYISAETWELIKTRDAMIKDGCSERLKIINKCIKKEARKDRLRHTLATLDKSLDVKDRWLGIRKIKKPFTPAVYELRDKHGRPTPPCKHAEATADYLSNVQWADDLGQDPLIGEEPIYPMTLEDYFLSDITVEEITAQLDRAKSDRAPGPDGITADILKCIHVDNLQPLVDLLCKWWRDKFVPTEDLQAKVVSIFKKGNPQILANYRPISLLNAIYKVYAGVLKARLELGIDHKLSKLQFGFRRGKSTA